jgi:hypothetical protein
MRMVGGFAQWKSHPNRARIDLFSALDDLSRKRTADIIGEAAKSDASPGSNERKVADRLRPDLQIEITRGCSAASVSDQRTLAH